MKFACDESERKSPIRHLRANLYNTEIHKKAVGTCVSLRDSRLGELDQLGVAFPTKTGDIHANVCHVVDCF